MIFIAQADIFKPTASKDIVFYDTLPPKTFSVGANMEGLFLKLAEDLTKPSKIYGDAEKRAKRIINTWKTRDRATGILLTGEKGSGKTMLARVISHEMRKIEVPTILVNGAYAGESFNSFMDAIGPAVVIFDEFEKVYHEQEAQSSLLTLMDGTHSTQKLFIMTCNNEYKLVEQMTNRPGRFFYKLRYTGLDQDFVREYCELNLNNKDHIQSVVSYATLFHEFNFDMLAAIVEDMNRYDEPLTETVKYINASPENGSNNYKIRRFEPTDENLYKDPKPDFDEKTGINVNPLKRFSIGFYFNNTIDGDPQDYGSFSFSHENIVKVDQNGTFYFESPEARLVLERLYPARFSVMDLMF